MAYTKQTWADLPSKTTPINAERLTHIEDGIFNAAQTADTAASTAGTAAANVGIVSGRVETLTERVNGLDTAVSNKVDKVAGKGLSTNDYDDTDKGKVDSLGTASTKNSTSVVTQSTDLVESGAVYDALGFGNKNLLPNNATSQTVNGVTFTVNADGSVTANGTATERTLFEIYTNYRHSKSWNGYILSGCPSGGGENSYRLDISNVDTASEGDDGSEKTITVDTTGKIIVRIRIANGYTANNLTFYPMISKDGGAYEPYHASVEETLRDAEVIEGKNLFGAGYSAIDVTNTLRPAAEQRLIATINNPNEIVFRANNGDYSTAFFEIDGIDGTADYAITYEIKDNNTGYTPTVSIHPDASTSSKLTLMIYAKNGSTALSSDKHFTLYNIQVEKGSTATAYEPYYTPLKDVVPQKCDNSVIAPVENGTTASQAYAVGEHFIRDGAFCTVTQAISSGGTLTEGTNYTNGDVADNLVYKAGDSIDVGDGTYPTMYNGIFFTNQSLRFVIRVDKKIIANNVAISNSGIGICNADGTVASVLNLTANYNIIILNIKNTDIQVQMSKKDGTAFSVTDGSTAVVRFYGTLTFS